MIEDDDEALDEDGDWRETIALGLGQPRTSARRQLALIAGILIVSIAVLVGLVAAGAAVFRVVGDRAQHHTRSYQYGAKLAVDLGGPTSENASHAELRTACRLKIEQGPAVPTWLVVDEAVDGCADGLSD